jgi:hypothetical protein
LPAFLTAKNLKPFISKELEVTSSQVEFMALNGQRAFGYPAELLRLVCEVYLDAKEEGVLTKNQEHVAKQAKIIHRGLAHVGIIALVDEATGYERDKERNDLARILKAFVAKELQKWLPTFDLEFYELMCDIRKERDDFVKMLDKTHPKYKHLPLFDPPED